VSRAVVYPAQAVAQSRVLAYGQDLAAAEIPLVATDEAPLTGATYSGFDDMRDRQIELVITTLELNGMADLAKAFRAPPGGSPR